MIDTTPTLDRDEELASAKLGIEAEGFLRTNLGRYMTGACEIEIEQLKKELVDADPLDSGENLRIRNEIKLRQMFLDHLDYLILNGQVARENIQRADDAALD